jgi:hypothetical protein
MLDRATLQLAAAQGNPHALMLLRMDNNVAQSQDESDRRWRNMCAYTATAKPLTGSDWLMAFRRYGFEPAAQVPAAKLRTGMDFPTWLSACGGCSDPSPTYPAQGEPDAPVKCDLCEQTGATMRCSWCGEWYCSQACFVQDWPKHKPICMQAANGRLCSSFGEIVPRRPVPLWTAVQYAKTFGLPPPPSTSAATGTSSSGSAPQGDGSSSGASAPARGTSGSAGTSTPAAGNSSSSSSSSSGGTAGLAQALAQALRLREQQPPQRPPAAEEEEAALDTHQQQDQHSAGPSKSAKRNAKRREKEKRDKQQAAAAAAGSAGACGEGPSPGVQGKGDSQAC